MKTLLPILLLSASLTTTAQTVNIPDAVLKDRLVNHNPNIDTNNDGEIQVSEATAFTGTLNLNPPIYERQNNNLASNSQFSDPTGIEAFINITKLYASNNLMSTIDLSANLKLTEIILNYNPLTSINIDGITGLANLHVTHANLTTINLTSNTSLSRLLLGDNNSLSSIDLSNLVNLTVLNLGSCNFSTITLPNDAINLRTLALQFNNLSSLDLTNYKNLESIFVNDNELTSIDVTGLTELITLNVKNNQLPSIDVSTNTVLESLTASDNNITSIDVSNNNNLFVFNVIRNSLTAVKFIHQPSIDAINQNRSFRYNLEQNPSLTCIEVDSPDYANTHNQTRFVKDPEASYQADCGYSLNTQDLELVNVSLYPNPSNGTFNINLPNKSSKNISIYNISGQKVFEASLEKDENTVTTNLPSGMYVARIESDNKLINIPFIIGNLN